jgi:sulfate adenylyltransferase subunit 1
MVCWFNERPLQLNGRYVVRHYSNELLCAVKAVDFKVNIDTLEKESSDQSVRMNDIAHIRIRCAKPLFYDSYRENNITGSLILIDETTNETVAAGMIL